MAKQFTSALPLPQSKNLHQILDKKAIIFSSWTRIFSTNSNNSNSIYRNSGCIKYGLHSRGLASVSATSLPSLSSSHLSLRSNCHCFCFSSLPLLPLCRSHLPSLWLSVMSHSGQHEDGPTVPQDSTKTIRCVIKGRVQGVFYRNWTIENATQLGVKGWVRNRRDGSVESLFSGKAEAIDEMLQRCGRGPPDAMVTALEANPSQEDPGVSFERKPTV